MKQEIPLQNGHIYVTPHLPSNEEKILYCDLPKKEQYWRREGIPDNYKRLSQPEKWAIQDIFWERYFDGVWMMNNGELIYLPGRAWFFFECWSGDFDTPDRHPEFRMEQLKYYYLKELAAIDPKCFGTFKFKQRRDGATHQEVCDNIYEGIQLVQEKEFGIISKSNDDAKKVCWRKMIRGFKGIPPFFKPIQKGSTEPKEELAFGKPSTRITSSNYKKIREQEENEDDDDGSLNNYYDYKATGTDVYDGRKLYRLLIDEYCKFPSDVSPSQCLATHIECVRQKAKKVGQIHIITSPIEYYCQSFEDSVTLWKESDFERIEEFGGGTKSGLWRWFSSAKKSAEDNENPNMPKFIDKYGYCDEDRAEEWIMGERKKCTTQQALRSIIMKMPLYIEEIIDTSNVESVFTHTEEMKNRKHFIIANPYKDKAKQERATVYGNLEWKDAIQDTEVIFVPSKNQNDFSTTGKFRFAYQPNEWECNRFVIRGDDKFPYGDSNFTIGIDPYDYRRVIGKAPSKGCAFAHKTFSFDDSDGVDNFYFEYYERPKTPEIFCEDMIKAAVYLGAHVQFEAKNMKIADWFEDRGYWAFLMNYDLKKRNERKGNPATADLTQEMLSLIDQYFSVPIIEEKRNNFDYFWFDDVLEEAPKFDPDETQQFHKIMALGQTLKGVQKRRLLRGNYKPDSVMVKEMMDYLVEMN